MYKFLKLIIVSFFIISCNNSVKFENKSINFSTSKDCNTIFDFGTASFKILHTDNLSNISDSVNLNLIKIVKDNIFNEIRFDTVTTYKGLGRQFIQNFYTEKRASKDKTISSYSLNISHVLSYQSEKLLNFQIHFKKDSNEIYDYFGVLSLIIEKETGRKIPSYKIFKDKDLQIVIEIAEIAFREKYKIEFGDSYNKNGYYFENNKFQLPENIFFVKDGLLFVYNPYEISNFKNGNIAFQIPYIEIGKYMSIR